jgi:hypothetical protein
MLVTNSATSAAGAASGEHRRGDRAREALGREVGELHDLLEALLDGRRRQGSRPARVRRRQGEGPRDPRVAAIELEGEPAAERESRDVRPSQPERLDERRQAVREVGEGERLRRIRRAAGAGRVPGNDRELVGELVDLPAPRDGAVADVAVDEYERRAGAGALVGDAKPARLDLAALRHRRRSGHRFRRIR